VKIIEVEGIGPQYAERLTAAGVTTTDELLERGGSTKGRTALESATGISGKLILEWVNHADLMRIDGVGSEYADLLEAAGVDSPAELAHRNPANLATTFQELDAARPNTVRQVPSEATIAGWIEQAKGLERSVSHGGGADTPLSDASAAPAPTPAPSPAPAPIATPSAASPATATPAAPARPSPSPADKPAPSSAEKPAAAAADTPAEATGLWARIKRMFGG
jgi:predicted flap endonuclease-1-like 5' DNA nuclease